MSKVILITGASRGIGKATAEAFGAAGWTLVLAARDPAPVAALAEGSGGLAVPTDVSDPNSVDQAFAMIADRFGRLDTVFNNAGVFPPSADPGALSFSDWRRTMAVNLDGAFLVASAAFRQMKAQSPQGGRIINNGSIAAYVPRPRSIAYAASKHAITGMTRSIALDGRPYDILCSQIDIGNAASDMTAAMADGVPQADGSLRPEPTMDVTLVAQSILHIAELPLSANILFQTIMASQMPYVGRG